MARIWTELFRGDGIPIEYWKPVDSPQRAQTLDPPYVLIVEVASFAFRFISAEQIRDCLAYYELRTRPSSRLNIGSADHWEAQRWFERLPMYLLEEPKRAKVVKALRRALTLADSGALTNSRRHCAV